MLEPYSSILCCVRVDPSTQKYRFSSACGVCSGPATTTTFCCIPKQIDRACHLCVCGNAQKMFCYPFCLTHVSTDHTVWCPFGRWKARDYFCILCWYLKPEACGCVPFCCGCSPTSCCFLTGAYVKDKDLFNASVFPAVCPCLFDQWACWCCGNTQDWRFCCLYVERKVYHHQICGLNVVACCFPCICITVDEDEQQTTRTTVAPFICYHMKEVRSTPPPQSMSTTGAAAVRREGERD